MYTFLGLIYRFDFQNKINYISLFLSIYLDYSMPLLMTSLFKNEILFKIMKFNYMY